jgi:hypothetical protein
MSSRYDPVEPEPKAAATDPSPPPPVNKAALIKAAIGIVVAAAIAVAAAFNFDLCGFCASVGVRLDKCAVPAPATPTVPAQ